MSAQSSESLCHLNATDLVAGYRRGDFSPVEVLDAVLSRTERLNPRFNMFFHIAQESARQEALVSERRWKEGQPLGLLDGVPVSIKDSIAMKGAPMQVGSRALRKIVSAQDAPPAARLREAGAVLFAKTTMPDHGMFGSGVSTAFGVTRNPWNPAFNTGGSSSGAGAALAAGLGALSVGTDIAGSVRFPASLCGLASLKPTHGLVPHLPVVAVREAGPMARSARDLAAMLHVLAGTDKRDYGSFPALAAGVPGWREPKGLRVGLLLDVGYGNKAEPAVVAAVRNAAETLARAGAQVEEMSALLNVDVLVPLAQMSATTMLARFEAMSQEQRDLSYLPLLEFAERARRLTALDYQAAIQAVDVAKAEVVRATAAYDYVLAPVVNKVNWAAESNAPDDDDIYRLTSYCGMFNQTGQPVGCVCAGFDERGLPIGMQIIGQRFDDRGVMQLAEQYEALRGFDMQWPECQ
ncbi:amidase [Candidimonas nitroreducens]|nr:amidase [Candidimonas nitroreducens]